jgi:cytosine/creatinine deaminase
MEPDLIIRAARLPDGRGPVDLVIDDGLIQAVGQGIEAKARQEIDATGRLVSPPFVDAHFHMDATLSLGLPRRNLSGTLLEGIALWGELKPMLNVEAVVERALAYCDMAVAQGIGAIRSHVDICDDRLVGLEALLSVKRRVAPYLELQLVAFPQDGFYRFPTARENLLRAIELGVEVVGGIPHFERTMEDGRRSVRELCEIAADRGLPVDMHCDESDDPFSRHIEVLACEAQRLGLQGRVTASHATSMHSMDDFYVGKLLPLIREAGLSVIANPLINIVLQGRHDGYPKRRGLTRVPELMASGTPVAFGHDCVMDPWYGLGSGDMLEVAHMGAHVAQMTGVAELGTCFEAITTVPAGILGLEHYGLEPGCHADLVVLEAGDPVEAIRLKATRLHVIRRGKVIAETPPRVAFLDLPERPSAVTLTRPLAAG